VAGLPYNDSIWGDYRTSELLNISIPSGFDLVISLCVVCVPSSVNDVIINMFSYLLSYPSVPN